MLFYRPQIADECSVNFITIKLVEVEVLDLARLAVVINQILTESDGFGARKNVLVLRSIMLCK